MILERQVLWLPNQSKTEQTDGGLAFAAVEFVRTPLSMLHLDYHSGSTVTLLRLTVLWPWCRFLPSVVIRINCDTKLTARSLGRVMYIRLTKTRNCYLVHILREN